MYAKGKNRYALESLPKRITNNEFQTKHKYCRPVGTLSAIAVNGQQDSSIPPPKQHSSTCHRPIMLSGLADIPCPDFGIDIDAMFEEINVSATLSVTHNLEEEQVRTFKLAEEGPE